MRINAQWSLTPAISRDRQRTAQPLPVAVLKPCVGWSARSALLGRNRSRTDPTGGRFTRGDVKRVLAAAWATFDRRSARLPRESTLGSRQNVQLACLTLSMLEALTAAGIQREYAIELIGDACWKVYAQWGQIPRAVSRMVTRDPARRMRIGVEMFLHYPFNRPGYRYTDVPEPRGRGLDMLRCPVADYLISEAAGDLCVATWCNLDFPLAHMWGGELERHGTLAAGEPRCDFRFRASGPDSARDRQGARRVRRQRPSGSAIAR